MARYRSKGFINQVAREMERSAKQRSKELQRQRKELERLQRDQARLSKEMEKQRVLEYARQEVAEYENEIELLHSLHKDCAATVDWRQLATTLKPFDANRFASQSRKEWRLKCMENLVIVGEAPVMIDSSNGDSEGRAMANRPATWKQHVQLAKDVLDAKADAYFEAMNTFSNLDEISGYGNEIEITFHSATRLEISLELNGPEIIPSETKSLLKSGKLSVKQTANKALSDLYQDHICSCMLRIAREAFAILPIFELRLNALAPVFNSASGHQESSIIYSVIMDRESIRGLSFDLLDPSDAIESFPHHGDFKASRKSGAFQPVSIIHFTQSEPVVQSQSLSQLLDEVRHGILNLSGDDSINQNLEED